MTIAIIIALCVYAFVTIRFTKAWNQLQWSRGAFPSNENVSIVIALRNEQAVVGQLIQSLSRLNYPTDKLEIVLVDDHSEDETYDKLVRLKNACDFKVSVYRLGVNQSGKKSAIRLGVEHAAYDTILFTDADCILSENWVHAMLSTADLTAGPVKYKNSKGWLNALIQLDFINLVAIGGSLIKLHKPILANGANMRIRRALYKSVSEHDLKDHVASGDDVFLLQAASQQQKVIDFCANADALVTTELPQTSKDFFRQRVRWAKKMKYTNILGNAYLVGLFGVYVVLCGLTLLLIIQPTQSVVQLFLVTYLVKYVLDLRYFKSLLTVFREEQLLKQLWWIEILHPIYVVGFAIISLFAPVKWKNRAYKNG